MNAKNLSRLMSELGKRSWETRKARDPENKHLKKISRKGLKTRRERLIGKQKTI